MTQDQCVSLLERATEEILPEYEWHAFIGMSIRGNPALETLRMQCIAIDEEGIKGTHKVKGQACLLFNQQGRVQLSVLLDEWQHKTDYLI
ncbi:hypothetical protein [Marinomonas algarum]|uniref:Uncharacterized protein n=1 Tax=Marinomonas algarum TaxID=2883105 RepID=A0A9X1LEY0_9GAMM|nr:hypothetical protein [Marinomonas algarum]MCB5162251.1 hypothetical protein [Marinomonas algarum]